MRWIWIDKFTDFESGRFARAIKTISSAEEQLRDYLPGYPMMPASLIIEGMAQTGGILAGEARGFKKMVVLAKLSRVDFHGVALPGDRITYEATLMDLRAEGAVVDVKATNNGQLLAEAEIVYGHVQPAHEQSTSASRYLAFKQELLETLQVPVRSESRAATVGADATRSS